MNKEFFAALDILEAEKHIPKEYMYEKIKAAIAATFKREKGVPPECVDVIFNETKHTMTAVIKKTVVEEVEDPTCQMTLDEARMKSKRYKVGDVVDVPVDPSAVGRIAAKIGKNVIVQAINEAVNGSIIQEFESKTGTLMTGIVRSADPGSKTVTVEVNNHEFPLFSREQIPNETFSEGDVIKVCVNVYDSDMRRSSKGGKEVLLSRSSTEFINKLFELEVPEIAQGAVEIRGIAREAGSRSKVAVVSTDANVDPVGACIGPRQSRINSILAELKGERIDLIRYSDDPKAFVVAALSPANVKVFEMDVNAKSCRVVVPADQLSLAIGKTGQNVRLAARLTGYRIDIISE